MTKKDLFGLILFGFWVNFPSFTLPFLMIKGFTAGIWYSLFFIDIDRQFREIGNVFYAQFQLIDALLKSLGLGPLDPKKRKTKKTK